MLLTGQGHFLILQVRHSVDQQLHFASNAKCLFARSLHEKQNNGQHPEHLIRVRYGIALCISNYSKCSL